MASKMTVKKIFALFLSVMLCFLLTVAAIWGYWAYHIPPGDTVINTDAPALAAGDTWRQEDLFELTIENVTAAAQADNEYVYTVKLKISNLNYAGCLDFHQIAKPYTEGLAFLGIVKGFDAAGQEVALTEIAPQERYLVQSLMPKERAEMDYVLLSETPLHQLDVQFKTTQAFQESHLKERLPRPVYVRSYALDVADLL